MTVNISSPITGGAQTGFTSPTYTVAADNNPANNGKQWVVTALGGTQTGVTAHTAADPFTISFFKPLAYKVLNFVSSTVFRKPPRNTYTVIVRKGVAFLSGQPRDILMIKTTIDIPSGSDTLEPANVRAAISALVGALNQQSAGLGDSCVSNTL